MNTRVKTVALGLAGLALAVGLAGLMSVTTPAVSQPVSGGLLMPQVLYSGILATNSGTNVLPSVDCSQGKEFALQLYFQNTAVPTSNKGSNAVVEVFQSLDNSRWETLRTITFTQRGIGTSDQTFVTNLTVNAVKYIKVNLTNLMSDVIMSNISLRANVK